MSPQPGEIWLADLGLAAKTRPVVIVSRQDPEPPRSLVLYVPLTTQRRDSPYEVPLPRFPFLDRESVANVQGLGSLPFVRLERKLGRLSAERMERFEVRAGLCSGSSITLIPLCGPALAGTGTGPAICSQVAAEPA
ncbi:MAG: type II toxin-antitoxin system PemK/MazF family toxin [Candidatus Solibacter sp.]